MLDIPNERSSHTRPVPCGGGLGWIVLGWLGNQTLVVALGLLLASTSLGFLGYNWPPAKIFMGDVGSAFLGYTFAVLPVVAVQRDPRFALAGVLLVWPFVFDAAFTFLRRFANPHLPPNY
ncbi:MAG: hypothetical protein NT118_01805 [Lentisphaerae bacterium]|nr:hypothetical protein [Lentisphaerota bacterium]